MDFFNTNFNQGFPIELDDIRFLQEQYRNGIHQLAQSLASDAILTGCELSQAQDGSDQVNAGWIIINGEIGYLPETSGLDVDSTYRVVANNYIDNSITKQIFGTNLLVKPYEIRQFQIIPNHPSASASPSLWQMKSMIDVIKGKLGIPDQPLKRSWITNAPSSFIWNGLAGRYEGSITHNQPNAINGIQGVSIMLHELTSGRLMSLPSSFSYEITLTDIIIIDNSSQNSNDDMRGLIIGGGLKIIFEHL